jgi:hypothetical protein
MDMRIGQLQRRLAENWLRQWQTTARGELRWFSYYFPTLIRCIILAMHNRHQQAPVMDRFLE